LNKCELTPPAEAAVAATIEDTFPVKLQDSASCPRYLGRVIRNVDLSRGTPLWMSEKLRRCGLRSIDPAVDVTNYVLLELGQPMHAFDLDELKDEIQVRPAKRGETLVLLDGQKAELREDTLVIADGSGPLAMAGIMGGEHSGVTTKTRNIFLECAYFAPLAVAGKARSYGLHTDSSHRFERGVDTEIQHRAMERATELLLEIVGGQPGPVVEAKDASHLPQPRKVTLRAARLHSLLGIEVPGDEVEEILSRLGLTLVSKTDEDWTFTVPSYRHDISIEPDLIEEVGRIYGYNNLPRTSAFGALELRPDHEATKPVEVLRQQLVSRGYQEAITYSFVDAKVQELVDPEASAVALANPISADMGVMRTSLWPGLLKAMSYNQNRQQSRIKMFETGLRFKLVNGELQQQLSLAGAVYGLANEESWSSTKRNLDFFDVKGDLEALFSGVADDFAFSAGSHPALHPGQCAEVHKSGEKIGYLGAVHPKLQKSLDLNGPVYLFELCLEKTVQGQVPYFTEVSRYPEIRRDLAIVVDRSVRFGEIESVIKQAAGNDLVSMKVFDVYAGASLAENERSIGVGLVWQRVDRTLQDEEVATAFDQIVSALADKFDARLRS
ncbi:MAG: phenylalanine--tRNA ligase subunit beta, partial [Oleiphilaceae bacterium]|nr:phenylalanine--tRNA ligase subunit beta [Oleiphilaceae bacterium]